MNVSGGASQQTRNETQEIYRLFMVPGMNHCKGGPGANAFDMFTPLVLATLYVNNSPREGVASTRPHVLLSTEGGLGENQCDRCLRAPPSEVAPAFQPRLVRLRLKASRCLWLREMPVQLAATLTIKSRLQPSSSARMPFVHRGTTRVLAGTKFADWTDPSAYWSETPSNTRMSRP